MSEVIVDVVFLTYNSYRDIQSPIVDLDSTCHAGIIELHEHKKLKRKEKYLMGTDAYNHYKWYNSCLKLECRKLDNNNSFASNNNTKLKILHWNIESGNIEAFKMQGVTYQAVSTIISPGVEYWYCANQGPDALHTFGSRVRGSSTVGDGSDDDVSNKSCSRDDSCMKNNCIECKKETKSPITTVKNPVNYIINKLENVSPVMKAIDLLNQKKNILRNGVSGTPKVQNYKVKKNGLKPIFEEHN